MSKSRPQKFYAWHYDMHDRFGETLHYYFISFLPIYDRSQVFKVLDELIAQQQIKGFAYYEVFGRYDLVLRVWLPTKISRRFDQTIRIFLRDVSVHEVESFHVDTKHFHWLWLADRKSETVEPIDKEVFDHVSAADISEFERTREERLASRYEKANLIRRFDPRPGITFFMAVSLPSPGTLRAVRIGLCNRIGQTMLAVENIHEPVLYQGDADYMWLLLKGKTDFEDYHYISKLNSQINDLGVGEHLIKTTTYLAVSLEEGFRRSEGINVDSYIPSPEPRRQITHYLELRESERFELKGSLKFDVNRYLAKGEKAYNKELTREVLQTIVAFLNTLGGELLIGVIEPNRITRGLRDKLEEFPVGGKYRVCGIDWDYDQHEWENYETTLNQLISSHVDSSIYRRLEIRRLNACDRDLCMITVPSGAQDWYYLNVTEFWVRQGAATLRLRGAEQEKYQRMNPRY